jgi:hypothetical protein
VFCFRWWPELPIVLAIFHMTFVMVDVIYSVHRQERASSRYTGGSRRLTKMVLHQGMFFLGAFYITWIPYLVLQVRKSCRRVFINLSQNKLTMRFLESICYHPVKVTASMD